MDAKTGLFYVFAALLLFAAFRVITARNPVHAALYLVLAFFQAAAIWILLKAEFLAITLVLVYVGAVMVLFLFVVMMLDINLDGARQGFWKHFPLAGTVTLGHFLSLGAMLFALSVIGIFLNRKNLIILLMAIELMLLAVNMNFVAFSYYLNDMAGQIFVFFILTVAAAESAIGLAILVLLFRNKSSINVDELNTLKG